MGEGSTCVGQWGGAWMHGSCGRIGWMVTEEHWGQKGDVPVEVALRKTRILQARCKGMDGVRGFDGFGRYAVGRGQPRTESDLQISRKDSYFAEERGVLVMQLPSSAFKQLPLRTRRKYPFDCDHVV